MGIPLATGRTATTGKKKFKFDYRPRTADEMKRRATQTGGGRDTFIDGKIKLFQAKSGAYRIRPMPPTWEDADHFGLEVYVHYGIGPDNAGYLCLNKMKGEACPLCEARNTAMQDGDEEIAKALRPTKRVLMYVIDRSAEGDGPKAWAAPWSKFDRELCAQAYDPDTGETIPVDSPDEGFDVTFNVEGQNQQKDYVGVQISRRARPISDNDDTAMEWLQFITDNPLPDILVYHDYEHMKSAWEGRAAPKDDERKEPEERPAATGRRPTITKEAGGGKPRIGSRPTIAKGKKEEQEEDPPAEDVLPTWEEVHAMNEEELGNFTEEQHIEFGKVKFSSVEECMDWVCEKLGIEENPEGSEETPPEEEPEEKPRATAAKASASLKDRLAGLRNKK